MTYRFFSMLALGHHLYILLTCEEFPHLKAGRWFIVGNNDSNHAITHSHLRRPMVLAYPEARSHERTKFRSHRHLT